MAILEAEGGLGHLLAFLEGLHRDVLEPTPQNDPRLVGQLRHQQRQTSVLRDPDARLDVLGRNPPRGHPLAGFGVPLDDPLAEHRHRLAEDLAVLGGEFVAGLLTGERQRLVDRVHLEGARARFKLVQQQSLKLGEKLLTRHVASSVVVDQLDLLSAACRTRPTLAGTVQRCLGA